jgi:hypothetical protein
MEEELGYTDESFVQAATFDWKKKAAAAAFVGATPARKKNSMTRRALDQSSRYADRSLDGSSSSRTASTLSSPTS